MTRIIKKQTLVTALIVACWLVLTLYLLGLFNIHSGWPAFLVLLFFIERGSKKESLKSIFFGGAVGILLASCLTLGVAFATPIIGKTYALYLLVFVAVFSLIVLKDLNSLFFNNYAFCYFTVALILPVQATFIWLLILFLGGAFFTGGIIMLENLFHKSIEETPQVSEKTDAA